MSGGQIGTALGGAIGFVVAGPAGIAIGMSLGGIAGSLISPDEIGVQDQEGPRLHDLKISSSTYGASISKVYGSYRLGGNILWSTPIQETKHEREEEVGKGGSEEYTVTWYTYSVDMAIAFCEGPVTGIRKIWADSVKIYDISEGGLTDQYRASEEASGPITMHLGTARQEVDWLSQSYNQDTPAYRNVVYISLNQFQLEKFGNRIPNFTAEIITDGFDTINHETGPVATKTVTYCPTETEDDVQIDPIKQFHSDQYDIIAYNGGSVETESDCRYIDLYKSTNDTFIASFIGRYQVTTSDTEIRKAKRVYSDNEEEVITEVSYEDTADFGSYLEVHSLSEPLYKRVDILPSQIPSTNVYTGTLFYRNEKIYAPYINSGYIELLFSGIPEEDTGSGYPSVVSDSIGLENNLVKSIYIGNGIEPTIYLFKKHVIGRYSIATRRNNKIVDEIEFYSEYDIDSVNSTTETNMYVDESLSLCFLHYNSGGVSRLHRINLGTSGVRTYDLPITSSFFINFHVDSNILRVTHNNNFESIALNLLGSNDVTVSSICEDLFLDSNLQQSDFDLSETDSITTTGFLIANQMNARAAISILQSAYIFDLIEDGWTLRSQLREKESLLTIPKDNLGANTEVSIEHTRKLETELPRKITVLYANIGIDYQQGSQSTVRIEGDSDHNIKIELPIVLTDTYAKQICEINMYRAWNEKDVYAFSIPSEYISLKVGDVIRIEYENSTVKVRIIKIIFTSDNILQCEAVRESSYTSTAIGSNTTDGFISNIPSTSNITSLLPINAPTLDNRFINSKVIYIGACGFSDNWGGCLVYKSIDGGANYGSIGSILNPVYNGLALSALASGTTTTWDLINSVEISLNSGSLTQSNITEVLRGANYAMLGNEIIQFVDIVEDNDKNTVTISKLLRGRRGTEWAISTHSINEKFTLLTYNMMVDYPTYNVERDYKGVSFNTNIDLANNIKNTYNGVNLVPLSPTRFEIVQGIDYDDNIYWSRRDRYVAGYMKTLPLSEVSESFVLKIYDSAAQLVRTENFTTEYTFNYTKQNKIDDGITLGEDIRYDIYQVGTEFNGYINSLTKSY